MNNIEINLIKTKNYKWEEIELPVDLFKEKIEAMLIWWAIWDAIWVPVEMKSNKYIEKKYWRVDEYLDSALNIFFNKWWLATWKKWLISDDTILTYTWIESILETWKIDFDNIMKLSIKNYKNFPYWFWGWTTTALKKYEELEIEKPNNKNYVNLWDKNSAWNWVIMKQSPYSAYFIANNIEDKSIEENIKTINKLTHAHPTAIVSSLVHNKFLMELLKSEDIDFKDLLNYLINYSKDLEEKYLEEDNDKVSNLLIKLLKDQNNWWLQTYDEILEKYWWWDKKIYSSWYVLTTLWIVYSLFLNKQDFEWFLDSINIGWDVDTFWAIIWNMIWAYKAKFYEKKYEEWLYDKEKLRKKTKDFINKILHNNVQ